MKQDGQALYLVRETKSTLDSAERRTKENQKIACGRKHFDMLGVDYGVVSAVGVFYLVPSLLLYLAAQRFLMQMSIGGVKG